MRTPQEIVAQINKCAIDKEKYSLGRLIILGILAGAYISIGAHLSVMVGYGFPAVAEHNPAIIKLLMGLVFPVGLVTIMLAGGELFTGNCAYFVPNILNGRQSWRVMLKSWGIVWVSNFIGALFFGYLFVYLTEMSHPETTHYGFFAIAAAKTSQSFLVIFLKGIAANWLVCLAIWIGTSSKSVAGKIMGLWIPIMTFVAIGYEHCIANMFFLPVAIFEGFDLSIGDMFTRNLIPATLGNIVGGTLFVGCAYWYLYDRK